MKDDETRRRRHLEGTPGGRSRRLLLLHNPVQHYAWGSRDQIPALLGAPAADRPWAELWMGAHPSAPSQARLGQTDELEPLDAAIAAHADELLGPEVAGRFGPRLPFLLKILAAARPLSIQCHPDAEAARAGYERENRLGVRLDAPERCFKDASHKPELLVALGRFEALAGWRDPAEIRDRLRAAGARSLDEDLEGIDHPGGLPRFFAALMRRGPEPARRLLEEVVATLAGDASVEAEWVRRLASQFPCDPAALAPLYLQHIVLERGQGLFLGPGLLHSYLAGVGLELMASSDNVLRGGLTEKHVALDELLRVARFEPGRPDILAPARQEDRLAVYPTPAYEFRLAVVDLEGGPYRRRRFGPEILLSLGGCRVQDDAGDVLELERGQSALVTAQVAEYELSGRGLVYLAGVP